MKRPLTIWCLVAASLVGVAAWADLVLVLKGVSLTSATINTAGTTLTLVYSTATTVSDATGLTVEFDNYAQRDLTYASGSGTDTHVFNFASPAKYTDADTDNDTAPVGTVCTLDYDNATGNISGLSSLTDQAVTNNSTAHPDPDLPEQIDTALPTGWDGVADHTPADNAALQELVDDDGTGDAEAGDVIELTAGVDYGLITFASTFTGTALNPIIFRTSDFDAVTGGDGNDGFPTFGETVLEADASLMATLSRAPSSNDHNILRFETGNGHMRFVGVQFIADGTYADANYLKLIYVGSGGVHFDRCIFTASDAIRVEECIQTGESAADFFVINSCFHNLFGSTGPDGATGVRLYDCAKALIYENTFEIMGPGFFTGDNNARSVTDLTFARNRVTRPSAWNDAGHGIQKTSGGETKTGTRVLVEENYLEQPFSNSWECISYKADGSGGPKDTTHVTTRWNKIVGSGTGRGILVHVSGSSPGATVGPNFDFKVEQNLVYGGNDRPLWFAVTTGFERLLVTHNTLLDGGVFSSGSDSGVNPSDYLVMRDNIIGGGYFENAGQHGAWSLNWAWGSSYSVTSNAWIGRSINEFDNDAAPAPTGTLTGNYFPADTTAIGFTNEAGGDYTIASGDYNAGGANDASDGTDLGCDVSTLNTALTGVAP